LNSRLEASGVKDGFEGNAQSFRIVTNVAIRSAGHLGLDLTRASLNAILKYPYPRAVDGTASKKWGHYYSERDDFVFNTWKQEGNTELFTRGDANKFFDSFT
jgi:dGTPase